MRHTILVVDDMEVNREILHTIFEQEYEVCLAEDGKEAIALIEEKGEDLSAILLDIVMPNVDGFGVLEFMREHNYMSSIPVLFITSDTSYESKRRGYEMGVSDFISKPFEPGIVTRRVRNLVELYRHKNNLEEIVELQTKEIREKNDKLAAMNERIINTLGTIVEFRSMESGNHIFRVRAFTEILLKYLMWDYPEYGVTEEQASTISFASVLHDVGKISIPDSVLMKPGKLTNEEFELMKTHTLRGAEVIERVFTDDDPEFQKYCLEIALSHHEKFDGRGYPNRLAGDEIPISAQVVSIADVYDALTSERVYKPPFPYEKAYEMILGGECGQFNPKLMECFKKARAEFERKAEELK